MQFFEQKGIPVCVLDSRNKKDMKQITQVVQQACAAKFERDRKRGIKNRPVRAMVAGIPNVGTLVKLKDKPVEKNILTGLVRKAASDYMKFMDHEANLYIMERIPNINLMNIQYFLPMVAGKIDGYYEVERIGFTTLDLEPALRLKLGRYIPIGESMVDIYGSKMKPGELISYDYTMKMYNGEV